MKNDFQPTLTGLAALAFAIYFFGYFELRAFLHWRGERLEPKDRRIPQRKWVSVSLGFLCLLIALPCALMNGNIPVRFYDWIRAVVMLVCLGLYLSIVRVEQRHKYRENRRLHEKEVERRRRLADETKNRA